MTPDEGKAYLNEFARKVRASEAEEMRKGDAYRELERTFKEECRRSGVGEEQAIEALRATMHARQAVEAKRWACYVWIGAGILWHLTLKGPGLLSINAAVFIGVGMLVASVVFGSVSYQIRKRLARHLSEQRPLPADSTVVLLGLGKSIVDTGLVVGVSYFLFVTLYP